MNSSTKELFPSEVEFCSDGICSDRIQFLTGIKPSKLESGISRILCTRKFDTIDSRVWFKKTLKNEFALRHALETEFSFWLKSNLQSSNPTSPESFAQEIWHKDSRIWFKNARKWICNATCSRNRIHFLTGIKPSERNRHLQNLMETEVTFWLKTIAENKPSQFEIWHLESRIKNWFQTVLPNRI